MANRIGIINTQGPSNWQRSNVVTYVKGERDAITIDVGKMARHAARLNAAPPPATRKIGDKRKKPPKHKKRLEDE